MIIGSLSLYIWQGQPPAYGMDVAHHYFLFSPSKVLQLP
jgi:hypothetical protein